MGSWTTASQHPSHALTTFSCNTQYSPQRTEYLSCKAIISVLEMQNVVNGPLTMMSKQQSWHFILFQENFISGGFEPSKSGISMMDSFCISVYSFASVFWCYTTQLLLHLLHILLA